MANMGHLAKRRMRSLLTLMMVGGYDGVMKFTLYSIFVLTTILARLSSPLRVLSIPVK